MKIEESEDNLLDLVRIITEYDLNDCGEYFSCLFFVLFVTFGNTWQCTYGFLSWTSVVWSKNISIFKDPEHNLNNNKNSFFYLSNENWLHNRFEHIRFFWNLNSSNVSKLYLVWHNLNSQSMYAFDDASQVNILHKAYYCTATAKFGSKPDYFI